MTECTLKTFRPVFEDFTTSRIKHLIYNLKTGRVARNTYTNDDGFDCPVRQGGAPFLLRNFRRIEWHYLLLFTVIVIVAAPCIWILQSVLERGWAPSPWRNEGLVFVRDRNYRVRGFIRDWDARKISNKELQTLLEQILEEREQRDRGPDEPGTASQPALVRREQSQVGQTKPSSLVAP